jgi:hypothetical protein
MSNPTRPFHNNTSQSDRAEVLRNDRANTFAGRAEAEVDEIRGRFAQEHKATVIGTGPVQYPMAAPNWSADPVGVEPPLNYEINETPIVGEPHEQAKGDTTDFPSSADVALGGATSEASTVGTAQSQLASPSPDLTGVNSVASVALRSDAEAPTAVSATWGAIRSR